MTLAAGPLVHALAQLYESLIEGIEPDEPQTWVLEVENDVHRQGHDGRKPAHVKPAARLAAAMP